MVFTSGIIPPPIRITHDRSIAGATGGLSASAPLDELGACACPSGRFGQRIYFRNLELKGFPTGALADKPPVAPGEAQILPRASFNREAVNSQLCNLKIRLFPWWHGRQCF